LRNRQAKKPATPAHAAGLSVRGPVSNHQEKKKKRKKKKVPVIIMGID
jgi:hypothetical protein